MTNCCKVAVSLYEALGHFIYEDGSCLGPVSDGIVLPFGDHVVTVELGHEPKEVFVSVNEKGLQTCGADISTVGVTVTDEGFKAYVHVKSNEAVFKWVAL